MRYMGRSRFWACDFWALLAILTCSCLLRTASGDPRTAVAGQFCGNSSSLSASGDSLDQSVCTTGNNSSSPNNFGKAVREVIGNVTAEAIRNEGFAVGSASVSNTSAYALAQCWQNLTQSQCSTCLNAAASSMVYMSVLPAVKDHAVLFAGCYMRYSTKLFWNVYPNGSSSSDANHEKNLVREQRIDIDQDVAEGLPNHAIVDVARSKSLYEDLMEKANVDTVVSNFDTVVSSFGLQVIDTVIQRGHRSRSEVWRHYHSDTLEEIVDKQINEENTKEFIRRVIHIALSCTEPNLGSRPSMLEVALQLIEARDD